MATEPLAIYQRTKIGETWSQWEKVNKRVQAGVSGGAWNGATLTTHVNLTGFTIDDPVVTTTLSAPAYATHGDISASISGLDRHGFTITLTRTITTTPGGFGVNWIATEN